MMINPIGINFNGKEWIWRESLKRGQTTLLKAKYSNRSFETALRRKQYLEVLRLLDDPPQDGEDIKGVDEKWKNRIDGQK